MFKKKKACHANEKPGMKKMPCDEKMYCLKNVSLQTTLP